MIKFFPASSDQLSVGNATGSRQQQLAQWERSLQVSTSRVSTPAHQNQGAGAHTDASRSQHTTSPAGGAVADVPSHGYALPEGASAVRPATGVDAARQAQALYGVAASAAVGPEGVTQVQPGRTAQVQLNVLSTRTLHGPLFMSELVQQDIERGRQRLSLLRDEKLLVIVRDYEAPDALLYDEGARQLRTVLAELGLEVSQVILNGALIFDEENGHAR